MSLTLRLFNTLTSKLVAYRFRVLLFGFLFCFSLAGMPVNVHAQAESAPFSVTFQVSDYNGFGVSCNGSNDGSIDLTIIDGTSPFNIEWSNGSTSEDISGLVAATYVVTVIDADQDTVIDSVSVSSPGLVTLTPVSVTDPLCNGDNNGSISITPAGGAGNFSYLWSNASTSEDISGLAAGNYTVTVTDANNCTATFDTLVAEPDELTALVNTVPANSAPDGEASVIASGGTLPFSYLWSTGSTDSLVTGLIPGSYTVTVTDVNNCTVSDIATIINAQGPCTINTDSTIQVSCNGLSTGAIYISLSAAIAPIDYSWSNGAVTEDITGLAAGTYTVTITDTSACTATQTFVITEPLLLSLSLTPAPETCNAGNGAITSNVIGGAGNYSYEWSGGQITPALASLTGGFYTLTVTDDNGCQVVETTQVLSFAPPAAAIDSLNNILCNGGSNGGMFISVTGGTQPYVYEWSNGAITQDINGVVAGTYTVTVTDDNLCSVVLNSFLTEPALLEDSVQVTNTTCEFDNGSATVFPYGGTAPYTYLWINSQTTQSINNVGVGVYNVTITDANLCTRQSQAIVGNEAGPVVSVSSIVNVACNGLSTGAVSINVTDGTAPFTFLWSNGFNSEDISNIPAGIYTVTVTDANSCTGTAFAQVQQPAVALNDSVQVVNESCGNDNGSIAIFPFGGTSSYSFLWNTGQTSQTISSLAAGTYTVTVTDANLCTKERSVIVIDQPAPVIVSDSTTNVSCKSGSDGAIYISVAGGTAPLDFLWSNNATTEDLVNITAGNYTVTVSDVNSCTATATYLISEPATPLSDSIQVTQAQCGFNNGSITAFPFGGTPGYSFLWSNLQTTATINNLTSGQYTVTITDANGCTAVEIASVASLTGPSAQIDSVVNIRCNGGTTGGIYISASGTSLPLTYLWSNGSVTQDLPGVGAGVYTVTVSDANLCTTTAGVTLTQPSSLVVNNTLSNATCNQANGSISIIPSGGVSPYFYLWNGGSGAPAISGLLAGNYTVTVTDANGCFSVLPFNITTTQEPVVLLDSVSSITCNGNPTGAIYITTSGGPGPFTYLWSNNVTTEDLENVVAGNYSVVITNSSNNCISEYDTTITQAAPINPNINTVPANGAPDGEATASPTGGAGSFSFLWSTGAITSGITGLLPGTYTVTITDGSSCSVTSNAVVQNASGACVITQDSVLDVSCFGNNNGAIFITVGPAIPPITYQWSNGATSEDITNLAPGTYTVTATDLFACNVTQSFVINEPALLDVNLSPVPETCNSNNGSVSSSVTGGTGLYSYAWSNGASTSGISNLTSNTYTVTVTDENGCTATESAVVNLNAPPQVALDSIRNVSCNGGNNGAIYISVTGGAVPISYVWSNSATSQDITGLASGSYTVTVTDADLCVSSLNANISQPLAALNDSVQSVNARCGNNNGSVTVFPYGGTLPYTYLWSNSQTSQTANSLLPGTYTVTITDANLCTRQRTASIINIPGPVASLDSVRNVRCNGGTTGSVYISASGGTNPLSYLWSTGAVSQDLLNVSNGTYTVTVTDANLCTSVVSGVVLQPSQPLNDSVQVANASCGSSNGSISIFAYNGTAPYTYLWNNLQTTSSLSNIPAGTYTVTITDANLCTRQRIVPVINSSGPVASLDSVRNVRCFGGNSGGVFISVSGGTLPLTYTWSGGQSSQDANNIPSGNYTVTVSDANSCTSVVNAIVNQPLAALNDSVQSLNARCGLNNGTITDYAFGGTAPYTYAWSSGQSSSAISSLPAGTYTVTITDANACTKQRTTVITAIPQPAAVADSIFNARCNGTSSGRIYIHVNGGSLPFVYNWSNGAVTQDIVNVAAGNYTVTVTDVYSCTSVFDTTITQPPPIVPNISTTDANAAPDGTAMSAPSGGTGPFTFLWSTGSVLPNITGLLPGTYTVTITDANLCSVVSTATVQNALGLCSIQTINVENVSCNGADDGSIDITVLAGIPPIDYIWSSGLTTEDISGLAPGTYTVTATDLLACVASASFVITEPAVLNVTSSAVDETCNSNNGIITTSVTGGTGPMDYLWSTGATSSSISNLNAGTYTVTVTDDNGCIDNIVTVVDSISPPQAIIDSVRNVRCFGGATGGIFISVNNGSPPFTYNWSTGATSQDLVNVLPGTYTVTVTDDSLCTSVISATITQPAAALNDSVQVTQAACALNNGTATVFPYGGTSPYTFLWNGGQTTATISGLAGGNYTVTITDNNSCTRVRTVTVGTAGLPVAVIDSVRNVACNGASTGAVYVSVIGGAGPFQYAWSNSAVTQDIVNVPFGIYTVTVTDANNCTSTADTVVSQATAITVNNNVTNETCNLDNGSITANASGGNGPYTYAWNTGQFTQTINNLSAGTFTVTVTDNNSCTKVTTSTLLNVGGVVAAVDSVRDVKCNGNATGAIFISVTSGTVPITYLWSTGFAGQDLVNVAAGIYTVTITDNNNCTATLTDTINQSAPLNDSLQVSSTNCGAPNGSATVFPYGGTPNYTVLWSTGSASTTIFNLSAGSYTVTITDANGCTRQDVANISNSGGPVVGIDSIVNVKCFGDSTGGFYISVTGGTSPYGYQWSNGSASQDLIGVPFGPYTVTITDDNNCIVIISGTINQPAILNDSINVTNATCGNSNGSITAFPFGGTAPYTYLWNGGGVSPGLTNIGPGIYTVTITDFNGCKKTDSDTVFTIGGPTLTVDSTFNVSCNGGNNGAVYTTATGGSGTLTYQWTNTPATSGDITGLTANTYTVTVTDQNNCSFSATAIVSQPAVLDDSTQVTPESCNAQNGSITVFPFGGTAPYDFVWSNTAVTPTISGLSSGNYTVTVTDSLGCTESTTVFVPQSGAPTATLDSIVDVRCNGDSTGAIYISPSGGSGTYTFLWSNNAATQNLVGIPAGVYSLILTDQLSCSDTTFYTVNEAAAIQDSINTNPATCGLNNGSAKIYPYGGVPNYTYQWSNGQLNQTAINLAPTTYTVTVTDANQCTITETVTIDSVLVHEIALDSIVDLNCNGAGTGAVYISVTLGEAPFDYEWTPGNFITEDITGVAAGIYNVSVTDNNNCTVTAQYTINEPAAITDTIIVVNSTCAQSNGSLNVIASGGSGNYSYIWSTGVNDTTPTITGLSSGLYTVTITDDSGCSVSSTAVVSDIGGPQITLDSLVNVTCNGGDNGAIYISVTDGTLPYDFEWSNSAQSDDITGLSAQSYTVTVTDDNGCQQFETYTITQPDPIVDSVVISDATCGAQNGFIQVIPSGGVAPYDYEWNTGVSTALISNIGAGTYTVTITDDADCELTVQYVVNNTGGPVITIASVVQVSCAGDSSGSIDISVTGGLDPYGYEWSNLESSEDLTNIIAGTYTVTVTDFNGCTASLAIPVNEPSPISASFVITDASCSGFNGAIDATITGGVGNYELLWSNTQTTPSINNLSAGIYTLTVTDDNNCTATFSPSVSNLSAPVISVVDSGNVSCNGAADGFITVNVTGGTPPYSYSWTNTSQTGNQITGLQGNTTYTLTITDNSGCITIRSVFISEPAPININAFIPQLNGSFNLTCAGSNDGSIKIQVSGGTGPYTYLWSNVATVDSIGGLAAGNYTVTVTDVNSCTTSQSFTLTQPPLLVSNAGSNKVICGNNIDTLNATPPAFGTGTWIIISGNATFADPNDPNTTITNLDNGVNVFQWVVTDGVCSAFSQVVITYNTQIIAIPGIDREVCADSVLLTATAPQFGTGYWQIVNSDGTITDSTKAVTLVTGLNFGSNIFKWTVINGSCSDSATVNIYLNTPAECIDILELPTGYTPNDDGKNDVFFVKGLDDYPENSIDVYNRWGNKVYEKNNYRNDWDGVNNDGEPLPEGTYFVIFKVKSINRIITSYVDIRR